MSDDQPQQSQPRQTTDLERAVLSLEHENNGRDVLINNTENTGDGSSSQASESLSSISDSIVRDSAVVAAVASPSRGGVDGSDFLSHLRAAGAFDSDIKNEDTFGRSSSRNDRQNLTALSALFEAPASVPITNNLFQHLSNEDTIGRSNKTSAAPPPQPKLTSLTDLFQRPETKLPQAPLLPGSSSQPFRSAAGGGAAAAGAVNNLPPFSPRPPSVSPPPTQFSPKSVLKKDPARSPSTITKSPHSGKESLYRNTEGEAPPPPRPLPLSHNRSVSWGNNTTLGPAPAVPGERFLERRASDKSFDSVSSLDAGNYHRRNDTRTQITLDDLIGNGPYEAEAESNIILALEAQQATRRHRPSLESSVSSPILGQVPETMAHDFSLDASAPEGSYTAPATLSPRSAGTSRNDNNSKDSEKAKLLNTNKKPKVPRHHRRHLSVEATLVGLTEAMSALHGDGKKTKTRQTDEPFSSANMFAENATRLSEQQEATHNSNDLGAASNHTRSRAWRIDLSMVDEDRQHQNGDDSPATTEVEDEDDRGTNTKSDNDPDPEQGQIETGEEDHDNEHSSDTDESKVTQSVSTRRKNKKHNIFEEATDKLKSEWEVWGAFLRPRRGHIRYYIRTTLLYIVFPLTGIAATLFYLCGNPGSRKNEDGTFEDTASVSWWFLFVVREVVTFSMALAMQGFVVDFLALGTKIMLKLVGPILTLLIVQAKGWPFICFWWAIFDLGLLASGGDISRHWLFWQDYVGLFNKENPSGSFASSGTHVTILAVVASVCAIVAIKRFVIGLYLGRQTFTHYGEKLARVMNHMLLVSEVAELAKDIERSRVDNEKHIPVISESFGWTGNLHGVVFPDDATCSTPVRSVDGSNNNMMIDTSARDPLTGSLPIQEKVKLIQLLGQWEEPTRASDPRQIEIASISAVLRFRKALTFIQKKYPFSYAFGPADTRENCIDSSQKVYERLLMHTPGEPVLQFETLALLALMDDDTIDQDKAKDLVKLFRPNREGLLSILDFTKSVDSVYKEFRMLSASIQNSSQIDRAFENMFNVGFYITLVTIVMSVLGLNPLALFLSLSSVILAFAFMIGSASSKYFEGVLFILVRRPYGIGDRIHVSDVEENTSIEGSLGWVVEHVTLFETIATWTPTQERCSLSNGSLANSRIINAARSPQPQFHLFLKFHIDEPYEKILIFKSAIEEFMRARPREWLALNGFRASRVVADQGYVEYVIAIQHRDSWQNIGLILDSKANLSSYCNEVAKQLNMHYRAPPLPVDLRFLQNSGNFGVIDPHSLNNLMNSGVTGPTTGQFARPADGAVLPVPLHTTINSPAMAAANTIVHPDISRSHQAAVEQHNAEIDREAHMKQFRHIALNKHNIRLN